MKRKIYKAKEFFAMCVFLWKEGSWEVAHDNAVYRQSAFDRSYSLEKEGKSYAPLCDKPLYKGLKESFFAPRIHKRVWGE
jgi:hypothetical protein